MLLYSVTKGLIMQSNTDYSLFSGRTFPSLDVLMSKNSEQDPVSEAVDFSSYFDTLGSQFEEVQKENIGVHKQLLNLKISNLKDPLKNRSVNVRTVFCNTKALIDILNKDLPQKGTHTPLFYKFFV